MKEKGHSLISNAGVFHSWMKYGPSVCDKRAEREKEKTSAGEKRSQLARRDSKPSLSLLPFTAHTLKTPSPPVQPSRWSSKSKERTPQRISIQSNPVSWSSPIRWLPPAADFGKESNFSPIFPLSHLTSRSSRLRRFRFKALPRPHHTSKKLSTMFPPSELEPQLPSSRSTRPHPVPLDNNSPVRRPPHRERLQL